MHIYISSGMDPNGQVGVAFCYYRVCYNYCEYSALSQITTMSAS